MPSKGSNIFIGRLRAYLLTGSFEFFYETDAAVVASEGLERPPKMRLECMCSFTLNGTVMGLEKVTLASSVRDTLVISFPEAKLSVVEYDPETRDLKTLSLHIFEVHHFCHLFKRKNVYITAV